MNKKWMMSKVRQYSFLNGVLAEPVGEDVKKSDETYLRTCVMLRQIEEEIEKELDRLYETKT